MQKNFFIIVLFFLTLFISPALADKLDSSPSPEFYTFHLWYAHGDLQKDTDFNFPFDQSFGKYQATPSASDTYQGKILSLKGKLLATIYFSPATLVSGSSGKLSLEAPYFPTAKTAIFYDVSGKELLTIDLAPGGPLCNEDGTCNANFGEDNQNCSMDCPKATTAEPEITVPAEKTTGTAILIILISVFGLLALVLGAWLIIRRRNA